MGNNPVNGVDPDGELFRNFGMNVKAFFFGGEFANPSSGRYGEKEGLFPSIGDGVGSFFSGIDLSKSNSGQLFADFLRNWAINKRADPTLTRPFLHEIIDINTTFGGVSEAIADLTGFGRMTSQISGRRKINGDLYTISILPRQSYQDGKWRYDPNTSENQLGRFGRRATQIRKGRIQYDVLYKNRANDKGLIVFTIYNNRNAAHSLYNYITGR